MFDLVCRRDEGFLILLPRVREGKSSSEKTGRVYSYSLGLLCVDGGNVTVLETSAVYVLVSDRVEFVTGIPGNCFQNTQFSALLPFLGMCAGA